MKAKKVWTYVLFLLLPLAVGGISSFITSRGMPAYDLLNKPWFTPPKAVFPVIWFTLYVLMGVGMARVWLTEDPRRKPALGVFLLQLTLNLFWTVWFFGLQRYWLAFWWLVVLVLVVGWMVRRFSVVDRLAGLLQVPYLIWTIFATALNLGIYLLNR